MARTSKNVTNAAFLFALLLAVLLTATSHAQEYLPYQLSLTVYADGIVKVDYWVNVPSDVLEFNITLWGKAIEDLLVESQQGTPLYYQFVSESTILVDSLGANVVRIIYYTPDLTSKVGRLWTLHIQSPVSTAITMPKEAIILSVNQIPISIGAVGGGTVLVMPSGLTEVSYTLEVAGTREHALVVINEVSSKIDEAKSSGLVVRQAEAKLSSARDLFERGLYIEAEQKAREAEEALKAIEAEAQRAKQAIDDAQHAISKAEGEGRTSNLSEAKLLLAQANESYLAGDYSSALSLAEKARASAEQATKPAEKIASYLLLFVIACAALAGGIAAYRARLRGRGLKPPTRTFRSIDFQKIIQECPDIKPEDGEVLQFIAESGGEAFESEVRERFRLPRTTVWRIVKRLQKQGIVDVQKVRGQNLVRIKDKYTAPSR